MSEQSERGIGLEIFELRVALALLGNINTEIEAQEDLWAARDLEWNDATGRDDTSIRLELVEDDHIYRGHRPSLIESQDVEDFPNISVMAYMGRPVEDIVDQATNYTIIVDVESFVKGETQSEVNSRSHRTTEAIHQVLERNKSLGGISMGWDNDPIIQITDVFKRKEHTGDGEDWFWQGTRLRYTCVRRTRLP